MSKNTLIWGLIFILFVVGVAWLIKTPGKPGKFDVLASCIAESGATFYGTFWCPFCQNQKAMFGSSARLLPYVECSTPDGNGQLQVCRDADVSSYPTWEFADGSRMSGLVDMETLASVTGCALPSGEIPQVEIMDESQSSEALGEEVEEELESEETPSN